MNQTPLNIIQDWYRTGDPALLSPEIEWRVLESFPSGGLYRGRDDVVARFFPSVKANFASYETCPANFLADDETVVVTGFYRVRVKLGSEAEAAFAHIWTVREGAITTFRQIADTAAINGAWG